MAKIAHSPTESQNSGQLPTSSKQPSVISGPKVNATPERPADSLMAMMTFVQRIFPKLMALYIYL